MGLQPFARVLPDVSAWASQAVEGLVGLPFRPYGRDGGKLAVTLELGSGRRLRFGLSDFGLAQPDGLADALSVVAVAARREPPTDFDLDGVL